MEIFDGVSFTRWSIDNEEKVIKDLESRVYVVVISFPLGISGGGLTVGFVGKCKRHRTHTRGNLKNSYTPTRDNVVRSFHGPMVRIPPFQGGGPCSIHGGCTIFLAFPAFFPKTITHQLKSTLSHQKSSICALSDEAQV